jgi:Trk-type K+ transport system membrane component
MRHYFYFHLVVFIIAGLLAGLTIYLIENYSKLKNQQMEVSYINAWFVACTCMYGCGLTTLDFAKLSKASQIILLVLTIIFGVTVGTLPLLIIKAHTHKHIKGITVDTDHGKEVENSEDDCQGSVSSVTNRCLPFELERKIALLPTPQQIRYWAYVVIIILVSTACASAYLCYFIILGAWLDARYSENDLKEGNVTISPWYTSIVIVITGFNQNGLTPFSDSMARFVTDVYMNIFVIMVFCLARKLEFRLG